MHRFSFGSLCDCRAVLYSSDNNTVCSSMFAFRSAMSSIFTSPNAFILIGCCKKFNTVNSEQQGKSVRVHVGSNRFWVPLLELKWLPFCHPSLTKTKNERWKVWYLPPELVHPHQYGGTGPADWPKCSARSAGWRSRCGLLLLQRLPLGRRTSRTVTDVFKCTVEWKHIRNTVKRIPAHIKIKITLLDSETDTHPDMVMQGALAASCEKPG